MSSEPRWFIPDVPEFDPKHDAFGHTDVANNLLTMIRGSGSERLMIGLLGEFGVGKSTVIELLTASLAGTPEVHVVRLSAERHLPLVFHRSIVYAFAEALVEQGLVSKKFAEERIRELEQSTARVERDFSRSPAARITRTIIGAGASKVLKTVGWWLLGVAIALGLVALVAALSGADVLAVLSAGWVTLALWLTIIGPVMQSLVQAVRLDKFFEPEPKTTTRPRVEAADEHERMFAALAEQVTGRLVIAIDDIDRLAPTEVLVSLNAIRGFQLTCRAGKQPVFIVSADERIVRSALNESAPRDGNKDSLSAAYLNRLFTQRQSMPQHAHIDLKEYAETVLSREVHAGAAKVGDDIHSILTILIHDGVNEPRHVIRMLNNFFGDYRLAMLREQRPGVRSMRKGEVTSHTRVLARLTVFKSDFPDFYDQLRQDTDLLALLDRKSRTVLPDETDAELLDRAGIDSATPEARRLLAFASRTAGWVEEVSNLLPFIYLGQDRLERALGSRETREARSFMMNAQGAALAELIDEASDGGDDERLSTLLELVVETLRTTTGLESENAIVAIVEASRAIPDSQKAPIADAAIAALSKTPSAAVDIEALIDLAEFASQEHMYATVASKLLEATPAAEAAERDIGLLRNRAAAARFTGDAALTKRLQETIGTLEVAEGLLGHSIWIDEALDGGHGDLHAALAGSVARRASRHAEELPRDWTTSAIRLFDDIPSADVDALVRTIAAAFGNGISGQAGRLLCVGVSKLEFTGAKLHASAVLALQEGALDESGEMHLGIEDEALDSLATFLTKAVHDAGTHVSQGVSVARTATGILAAVVATGGHIPTGMNLFYAAVLAKQPVVVTALFDALLERWADEDDDDPTSPLSAGTVGVVMNNLGELPEAELERAKAVLLKHLQPEPQNNLFSVVEYHLSSMIDVGTLSFATAVVEALSPHVRYNSVPAALRVYPALTVAFERADILAATASPLLTYAAQMLHQSEASKEVGIRVLTSIRWPGALVPSLLTELGAFGNQIDEEHAQLLVTQLSRHETPVPESLMPKFIEGIRSASQSSLETRRSAASDALRLVPIDVAVLIAPDLGDGPGRIAEILRAHDDKQKAKEYMSAVWAVADSIGSADLTPDRAAPLLYALFTESANDYVQAVNEMLDQQLSGDSAFASDAWAGIIGVYGDSEAGALADWVKRAIAGAASNVAGAVAVIGGSSGNARFAALLAPIGAAGLVRWVMEEHNVSVSAQLASALGLNDLTRASALLAIGPRGPRKNAAARPAYEAARAALATGGLRIAG